MPKRSPARNLPIADQEPAVANLLQRIEALRTWGEQWADYDAPPPSDATIKQAKQWLEELYGEVSSNGELWLDPMITVSEEGEVTFEWWNADRKLTVYVSKEGISFTKVTGCRDPLHLEDGRADTSPERRSLWTWQRSSI